MKVACGIWVHLEGLIFLPNAERWDQSCCLEFHIQLAFCNLQLLSDLPIVFFALSAQSCTTSLTCASLHQLGIWNHPRHINWWLLHPLICHNYFISDWCDCAVADGVCAEAQFPLHMKRSHFNWSLFSANCSLCCKSVSVSLPRSLLANCLSGILFSSWIELLRLSCVIDYDDCGVQSGNLGNYSQGYFVILFCFRRQPDTAAEG